MATQNRARQFGEVLTAEVEEINRRRETLDIPQVDAPQLERSPSTGPGLVGLALSGGGIRSATFGLGVIQALARHGKLKFADYLSTVSGGGYIGSCLSSLLNAKHAGPEGKSFPLRSEQGVEEPTAVRHLRNSGNYLAPGGLLDRVRIPTVILRGILINLFTFLPYLMLAVILTEFAYELGRGREAFFQPIPLLAAGAFLLLVITFPFVSRLFRNRFRWPERNRYGLILAFVLLVALLLVFVTPVILRILGWAIETSWDHLLDEANPSKGENYWKWLVAIALLLALMLVGKASETVSALSSQILLYAVGILGPAILFGIYLMLCVWQIDTPLIFLRQPFDLEAGRFQDDLNREIIPDDLREELEDNGVILSKTLTVTIVHADSLWRIEGDRAVYTVWEQNGRLYIYWNFQSDFDRHNRPVVPVKELVVLVRELSDKGIELSSSATLSLKDPTYKGSNRDSTHSGLWLVDGKYTIEKTDDHLRVDPLPVDLFDGRKDYLFYGIFILLFISNIFFLDVNITSPHGFYRDRLSKAYMIQESLETEGRFQSELDNGVMSRAFRKAFKNRGVSISRSAVVSTREEGSAWRIADMRGTYTVLKAGGQLTIHREDDIVPNDEQKLHQLNRQGAAAPYHLINVSLNLNGSEDPDVRGRDADFFIFSKRFTGSERTGYCETETMENVYDGHLNLGTAMAISGAAAAPNMGTTTVKPLVFIMTLLNIRLGYWLPNPAAIHGASWYKKMVLRLGAGAKYLLKEALGAIDAQSAHVNVSDGGHLENLAAYELLRRRCALIISVDGGADPKLRCGDLIKLIRYARIDMGIEIDINLKDVHKGEGGLSGKHWALGTIQYGDGETGHLLYIKSSMTGDEDQYVREYRRQDPAFPHQSTADQFFDETQFECYRALGYHIADNLFGKEGELNGARDAEPPGSPLAAFIEDGMGQG